MYQSDTFKTHIFSLFSLLLLVRFGPLSLSIFSLIFLPDFSELGLHFCPEDGGSCYLPDSTAAQLRKQ
jgi:hypothetical protein